MSKHKFSWKTKNGPFDLPRPIACVIRLGAFGDVCQASSVCASLKKQGYSVVFSTTYPASEIIAFDPSIDSIITQLQNEIPVNWLGHYWCWVRERCDKLINLTESVEGNLLATEGSIKFEWSPEARDMHMQHNYLEFQHAIAGVPYEPSFTFHPNADEKAWAAKEREKMRRVGIEKVILWGLAGSSRTHKLWPHQDSVWRHVFHHYKNAGIVTAGDASCKDLEVWPHEEPRLWTTSGKWNMRQVFTFMAEHADVVVGPETGLMSAAAFYPMPKLVFLSHSTVKNLTRDWVNTTSFWAPSTVCPGRGEAKVAACHCMLPSFRGCRRHEVHGTSQCVAEIKPEWVWQHLQQALVEGSGGVWSPPLLEA